MTCAPTAPAKEAGQGPPFLSRTPEPPPGNIQGWSLRMHPQSTERPRSRGSGKHGRQLWLSGTQRAGAQPKSGAQGAGSQCDKVKNWSLQATTTPVR